MNPSQKPVVLVFAGHDPSGGAGVQADIEALAAHGAHAATVITALTVQDTRDVRRFACVDPSLVAEQAETVLGDMPVAAIKTGMTGSADIVRTIARIVRHHPRIPLIVDPVLAAGGGAELGDVGTALREHLLPLATLATPNGPEARRLVPEADSPAACARVLIAAGCRHVLVTGGHETGPEVVSRLYAAGQELARHAWPRLPGEFHGSGCTLASAIAALLARGSSLPSAIDEGLAYTWHALDGARHPGRGQAIPDRFFALSGLRRQRDN